MNIQKITILIVAFKEPKTIGRAIESFLNQNIKEKYELVVSAPDKETQEVVKKYKKIKLLKDPGKGKSYALNLALKKIKGSIIILTDGDVYVSENSVNEVIEKFRDSKIGCVTGRPVPMEDKSTKYGYWANILFYSAHRLRKILQQEGKFFQCSGYLYAFRNNVITSFPLDVADDAIIPHLFSSKGYKIAYAEKAFVFVKNVNNWKDWANQKVRTSKSHERIDKYIDTKQSPKTKTFFNELKGIFFILSHPQNIRESFWTLQLIFARLYMWIKVFLDVHIKKRYYNDNWGRVESTK